VKIAKGSLKKSSEELPTVQRWAFFISDRVLQKKGGINGKRN